MATRVVVFVETYRVSPSTFQMNQSSGRNSPVSQPHQHPVRANPRQRVLRNVLDRRAAGQLHAPSEFIMDRLEHQLHTGLAVILSHEKEGKQISILLPSTTPLSPFKKELKTK
jgi:hypothetical protein